MALPDELNSRKVKNCFKKENYGRSSSLTQAAEQLFDYYQKYGIDAGDLENPFTTSRKSNRPINKISMKTMKCKWIQMIRVLNFPEHLTVRQVWWEIIRPKNVNEQFDEHGKR